MICETHQKTTHAHKIKDTLGPKEPGVKNVVYSRIIPWYNNIVITWNYLILKELYLTLELFINYSDYI